MSTPTLEADLRYPVGKFQTPRSVTAADRARWIDEIESLPDQLREAVKGLNDQQLDTPYRPDGWTIRQVVHHLPDSHTNSYVRVRMALTEERPAIKGYAEERWAELADAKSGAVDLSLSLVAALHARWVILFRSMGDQEFARTLLHPERGELRLDHLLAMYAWHGRHHVAHILNLRQQNGW